MIRLDNNHWLESEHTQRMTSREWRDLQVSQKDTILFNGSIVQLKSRSLGCDVVEIYKSKRGTYNGQIKE